MSWVYNGARVTVVEREGDVGGVWRYFANEGSRVLVSEPGYRLIPDRLLTDFTQKHDILGTERQEVAEQENPDVLWLSSWCCGLAMVWLS